MTSGLSQYGDLRVAVMILARNESHTIRAVVQGARQYAHSVLVLDGRSSDGTAALAAEAGARVYTDDGRGKGSALRQGLTLIDADVVVFMDADGSHNPADIPELALPVVRGQADLCVGSRFAGGSDELSVSVGQLVRTVGNILMNVAINRRWGVELTDTLNGFRAIRREVALAVGLREDRHTIEQEMVMKTLAQGYRVINVPAHEYSRRYGTSHIRIWREWPRFAWCVVRNLVRRDVVGRQAPVPSPAVYWLTIENEGDALVAGVATDG